MLDPFSVGSTAVGLVQLARSLVEEPGWAEKLAKKVADVVEDQDGFPVSRRALQRWLETEESWEVLVDLDPASTSQISATITEPVLRSSRQGRGLDPSEVERRALVIAERLRAQFLAALDPAYGIAVLHRRLEELYAPVGQEDASRIEGLPATVWGSLSDVTDVAPALGSRLTRFLRDHSSHPERVSQIVANQPDLPDWLGGAPYQAWIAMGDFLAAHEVHEGAHHAFRVAVDEGAPHAEILLVQAAIHVHDQDEDEARSLLDQSDLVGGPLGAVSKAVRAELDDQPEQLLSHLDDLDASESSVPAETSLLVAVLRTRALGAVGDTDSAVRLVKTMITQHPERSIFNIVLADLLIAEAEGPPVGHSERGRLLDEAAENLVAAVARRQSWQGTTRELVAKACALLMAVGKLERVVAVGMQGAGESAADLGIRASSVPSEVTLALIGLGRLDEARELTTGESSFAVAFLDAAQDDLEDHERVRQLFGVALEAAETPSERALVLQALADRGETVLPGIKELREIDAEWAAYIEASSLLANHDYRGVRRLTAAHRAQSGPHALLTARSHREEGDTDLAVDVLVDSSSALQSAELLAVAMAMLVDAERSEEAERLGLTALALYAGQSNARVAIRRQLLAIVEARSDWVTFTDYAAAFMQEFPNDLEAVWSRIYGLSVRNRWMQAWSAYTAADRPEAISPHSAGLKIDLESRFEATPESVQRAIELAESYPETEGVVAGAVHAAFIRASGIEMPRETREESQALLTRFFDEFPESDLVRQIPVDPNNPAEHIRPLLQPRARRYDEVAEKIASGEMPYGFGCEALGSLTQPGCCSIGPRGLFARRQSTKRFKRLRRAQPSTPSASKSQWTRACSQSPYEHSMQAFGRRDTSVASSSQMCCSTMPTLLWRTPGVRRPTPWSGTSLRTSQASQRAQTTS